MTFLECVATCFGNDEFRNQFNRLMNCSLGVDRRSPIARAIDKACNHEPPLFKKEETILFMAFVYEVVWTRLPREAFGGTEPVK